MLKIPTNIAGITSINNDHIDYYGAFSNLKNAFFQFANEADFAILPNSVSIDHDAINCITFWLEDGNIKASNIKQYAKSIRFDVLVDNNQRIKMWHYQMQ